MPEAIERPRILTLSDLIFGLALSIGALTLIGHQPSDAAVLFASLGLYGLSFLILISVWRLYSNITSVIPYETALLSGLNYLLLFLVSIEPYLFNELFIQTSISDVVSSVYAWDLAIMFVILATFNHTLADEERNLVPKSLLRVYSRSRDICLIVAGIFLISTIPQLGSIYVLSTTSGGASVAVSVRSILWILCLVVGWTRRIFIREQAQA